MTGEELFNKHYKPSKHLEIHSSSYGNKQETARQVGEIHKKATDDGKSVQWMEIRKISECDGGTYGIFWTERDLND